MITLGLHQRVDGVAAGFQRSLASELGAPYRFCVSAKRRRSIEFDVSGQRRGGRQIRVERGTDAHGMSSSICWCAITMARAAAMTRLKAPVMDGTGFAIWVGGLIWAQLPRPPSLSLETQ